MSWIDFYNEADHLGNRFGVPGPYYGPKGHLGVDFNRHAEGTPIPSWTAGTVVAVDYYTRLGNTVIVRTPLGLFAGWAHLRSRSKLTVGQSIRVGDTVGPLGDTGTSTTGPHVHCTLEPTIVIGTQNAIDPLPYIRKAKADAALAGGGTPIPIQQEESDMRVIAVPAGSIGLIGGHGEPVVFTNYATQGFLIEALVAAYGKVVVTPDQFTTHINFQKAQAAVNRQVDVDFDADRAAASIAAKLLEQNGVAPTAEEQAAAVVRALGPEFDAIPGDVVDELKTRL